MKICVYGASSRAIDPSFIEAGETIGKMLASKGHTIIYGGGGEGMMGAAARGAVSKNGVVIGITPSFFETDGVLFDKCTEMIYTETMRERKKLLEEMSDAFLVLPGGIGTYDELFEIMCLRQLGIHLKPIALCNINGYFDPLIEMLDKTAEKNFMTEKSKSIYFVSDDFDEIIKYLETHKGEKLKLDDYKDIR